MDSINKFLSFLNTNLSNIFPPELVGEIGQRFFLKFKLDKDITYDDLFKLSPYISSLNLGLNEKIVALPPNLPNLQSLNLGRNIKIDSLRDLPNLH